MAAVVFSDLTPTSVIHVSAGAAGVGDGSLAHPYATIQEAVLAATPGTAIFVHAGTYVENVKIPDTKSGTATAPIWLVSADGPSAAKIVAASNDKPAIQALGVDNYVIQNFDVSGGYDGIQFNQSGSNYKNMVSNIVVQGNVVHGAVNDGIKIGQASNAYILDNVIHDVTSQEGIDVLGSTNVVISRNEIYNLNNTTAAIFAKGGSSNVLISDNYIHDVTGDGISAGGVTSDSSMLPGATYEAKNVDVIGNKVINVGKQPVSVRGAIDVDVTGNYLVSNAKNNWAVYVTTGNPNSANVRYSSDVVISDNTTVGAKGLTRIDAGNNTAIVTSNNSASLAWSGDAGPDAVLMWGKVVAVVPAGLDPVPETPTTGSTIWAESAAATKTILGTSAADSLTGTKANELINGGSNADTMKGGAGDDTYVLSGYKDVVIEAANEGVDTVLLSDTRYQLTQNVENLIAKLDQATSLVGNAGNNMLIGAGGADVLVGAAGSDLMAGGAGADTFVVSGSDGSDTIRDFATGEKISLTGDEFASYAALKASLAQSGSDTVLTFSDGHTLTLKGVLASSLTASSFNFDGMSTSVAASGATTVTRGGTAGFDVVSGGDTNDLIDGKGGADLMIGGKGDDTYIVDNADDRIVEFGSGGTDQVFVYSNQYRLDAQVENATIKSALGATLEGNASANWLIGGAGSDTLIGGGGADRLTGGAGKDVFVFDSVADGADVITDFVRGADKLDLSGLYDAHSNGSWSTASTATGLAVYFDFDGTHNLIATLANTTSLSGTDFIT